MCIGYLIVGSGYLGLMKSNKIKFGLIILRNLLRKEFKKKGFEYFFKCNLVLWMF